MPISLDDDVLSGHISRVPHENHSKDLLHYKVVKLRKIISSFAHADILRTMFFKRLFVHDKRCIDDEFTMIFSPNFNGF